MKRLVDEFGFDTYDAVEDDCDELDENDVSYSFERTPYCDWGVGDSKGKCIKHRCGCNYSGCVYNEGV